MNKEQMNEIVPVEITVETLQARIYTVRGQRVMLAADLAEIFHKPITENSIIR